MASYEANRLSSRHYTCSRRVFDFCSDYGRPEHFDVRLFDIRLLDVRAASNKCYWRDRSFGTGLYTVYNGDVYPDGQWEPNGRLS